MIIPEQLAKSGSEDAEQAALFCWAQINTPKYPQLKCLFAVPNGGYRDARTAGKLKATGVKAGVPDIWLPVAKYHYMTEQLIAHGLIIELKIRSKAKPSDVWAGATDEQREWLTELNNQGYKAVVCYGWEHARDVIEEYLNG